ncbi:DUF4382 domain-containing protein [Parathalassolituus penaei]|uniref:DUF4382 domain-containing protein n=1 Tax=Parathalassolituus penaei TaxID=2997323 RepID=A0A9X3ISY4_9GAMM|nr:DUF4382 domain-containing protein [Parathalassolituus penaei]MCY0966907.1 DUF4382 domain-containing protein [Parathalassolituus penaei]
MKTKFLPLAMAILLLSGCGSDSSSVSTLTDSSADSTSSSDSSSSDTATDTTTDTSKTVGGTVQVALTDAEADFVTYQVTLNSITLVRTDGTEVDLLATATPVDFVQYQQLSELFAMSSVPTGSYSSVVLNLDYSNASLVIQDEDGVTYNASAVDSSGKALTSLDVTLQLDTDEPLTVADGELAGLTLDMDLAASNEVLSYDPAVVEVEPFLMVVASQNDTREHRVRGLLSEVDSSADSSAATITLAIRPLRLRSGDYGTLVCNVSDDTLYEIDGTEYTGSSGLELIAALDADSPLLAYGTLDSDGNFTASQVIAGTGVAWSGDDVVKGTIIARSDNTLTLGNSVHERDGSDTTFSSTTEVVIADTTSVTGYYEGDASIANLSVGQKVLVTGTMGDSQFDASSGLVRMQLSTVTGTSTVNPLTIDLLTVNNRSVDQYDFTGTGATVDADPSAYRIDIGVMDVSNLSNDDWVSIKGYPTKWAADSDYDFTALAVNEISFTSSTATYVSHWDSASSSAITISDSSLIIDNTDAVDRLSLSGVPDSLIESFVVSSISGESDGTFAIRTSDGTTTLLIWSEFVTTLGTALSDATTAGETVSHISASGSFDSSTGVLTATHVMVRIGTISNQHSDSIRSRHSNARSGSSGSDNDSDSSDHNSNNGGSYGNHH